MGEVVKNFQTRESVLEGKAGNLYDLEWKWHELINGLMVGFFPGSFPQQSLWWGALIELALQQNNFFSALKLETGICYRQKNTQLYH